MIIFDILEFFTQAIITNKVLFNKNLYKVHTIVIFPQLSLLIWLIEREASRIKNSGLKKQWKFIKLFLTATELYQSLACIYKIRQCAFLCYHTCSNCSIMHWSAFSRILPSKKINNNSKKQFGLIWIPLILVQQVFNKSISQNTFCVVRTHLWTNAWTSFI